MPSRRMKTKIARVIRKARKGKARKRREQNQGTTPSFPIHWQEPSAGIGASAGVSSQ